MSVFVNHVLLNVQKVLVKTEYCYVIIEKLLVSNFEGNDYSMNTWNDFCLQIM
jgi:hypothetical protein